MTGLPEGFRDTPLGPLPGTWEVVPLKEVLKEVDIRVKDFDSGDGELPVLSLTKDYGLILQTERFGKRIATKDVSKYKVVQHGQIVHNPYVIWEGAIHILDKHDQGIVSPVYPVWEVNPQKADAYFVDPLLRMPAAIAAYNRFAAGAVNRRRSIRKSDFLNVEIPLPPLLEQHAIAHVLRTVQEAREATERVIDAAREQKRSLMRHLFTYGPVPVAQADRVELQETEIWPIPAHWEVMPLGEAAAQGNGSIQTGPFGSLLHASDYIDFGSPVVMPRDLTAQGKIVTDEIAYIGERDYQRLERYHLRPGDVLVARRGEIGRRGLVTPREDGWVCGTGCLRIRPGKLLDPYFLVQAFETTGLRDWLTAHAVGTTMLNLSARILSQMLILCPSLAEQHEIARILTTVDAKVAAEEARRDALDDLFHSLLHHLMTARVRVPVS